MLFDALWSQKRILGAQITVERAEGPVGSYKYLLYLTAEKGGRSFGLIQPTLIQQLKKILDEYPDDGQILKVYKPQQSPCTAESDVSVFSSVVMPAQNKPKFCNIGKPIL